MKKKPDNMLRLAKAGGSAVARDSFDRPGGIMGKLGKAKHRAERHKIKQILKSKGDYDD